MGFLDTLLGKRKVAAPAAKDRLFAITTAHVTLETSLDITTAGKAAIVFQPLQTGDFARVSKEVEELVRSTGQETGTTIDVSDDEFGYRWFVVSDPDVEDLAVAVNAVSDALAVDGYADRVLAALFLFKEQSGQRVSFIYSYKRGFWYPFVPASGEKQRDSEKELRLQSQLSSDLPFEPELERWFPLWGIPI